VRQISIKYWEIPLVMAKMASAQVAKNMRDQIGFASGFGAFMFGSTADLVAAEQYENAGFWVTWVLCSEKQSDFAECSKKYAKGMLAAVTGEYIRGAAVRGSEVHPFRHYFEHLKIGDSLLTHRCTVSEADIVAFGGLSGDFFYMHFDEIAAKESPFGKRIAHGYFGTSGSGLVFCFDPPTRLHLAKGKT
jgi:hypothetical protein